MQRCVSANKALNHTGFWKRNIWALKVGLQDAYRFVQVKLENIYVNGHTIAAMHGWKKSPTESEPSKPAHHPMFNWCLIYVLAGASIEAACGRDCKCLMAEHSNIKAE